MEKSKLLSMLLSVLVAFALWTYVITEVQPESENTFYDIPITVVGESILNENNLMITNWSAQNVDLRLKGNRSDLNELNEANIILKADMSKIYEPGTHRIEYNISYPGNVAGNAFTKLSQYPESITVTVERRISKEVPVNIVYEGEVAENYMPRSSDVMLDYAYINVKGPSSVVDQIQQAVITVDLTDRKESISENYRFTLCDAQGNGVDSEMITVNTEEVHVDLTIHQYKWVTLTVTLVDGGGATGKNVKLSVEPEQIQLSGSDAVMSQIGDTISLGTINLADYTDDFEMTFPIPGFDGVTNDSVVTEATMKLEFDGLSTKEITLSNIQVANVPAGFEAMIAAQQLTVTVRGPAAVISGLHESHVSATVDFTNAKEGTDTYRVRVTFAEGFTEAGILGKPSVSATVQKPAEETEP